MVVVMTVMMAVGCGTVRLIRYSAAADSCKVKNIPEPEGDHVLLRHRKFHHHRRKPAAKELAPSAEPILSGALGVLGLGFIGRKGREWPKISDLFWEGGGF